MSLKGPHRTQPPPVPRGSATFPLVIACSFGSYTPSPDSEVSLQSKRGLAARLLAQRGQSQYLLTVIAGQCEKGDALREIAGVSTFISKGSLPKPDKSPMPCQEQSVVVDVKSVIDMCSGVLLSVLLWYIFTRDRNHTPQSRQSDSVLPDILRLEAGAASVACTEQHWCSLSARRASADSCEIRYEN